jgi:hypothetical protein
MTKAKVSTLKPINLPRHCTKFKILRLQENLSLNFICHILLVQRYSKDGKKFRSLGQKNNSATHKWICPMNETSEFSSSSKKEFNICSRLYSNSDLIGMYLLLTNLTFIGGFFK